MTARTGGDTITDLFPQQPVLAAIHLDGRTLVLAAMTAVGIPYRPGRVQAEGCTGHPGEPAGRTPAGDAWCGQCRRTEGRGRWIQEPAVPDTGYGY